MYIDESNASLTEMEAGLTQVVLYRCILMKISHLSFKSKLN